MKLLTDFFQRAAVSIDETKSLLKYFAFAWRQSIEHVLDAILEHRHGCHVARIFGPFVLNEITQARLLAVSNRGLKRNGLLRHLQNSTHTLDGKVNLLCNLIRRWLAAILLDQLLLDSHQLVDRFDHVNRNPDGSGLICDRASDCLANPPGRIGGKLVAAAVFEFFDRFHQAHVAFLD